MSYDISFYPRQPGQDWEAAIEADQQDGPEMTQEQLDAGVATFRRIEATVREHLTEPLEVWVAEETDGDVLGELTGLESGLQVELFDRSAAVSFPYQERPDAAAFHDQVRQVVRIVGQETGYEAYDAQTGRAFDGIIDDGPGIEAARALGDTTDGYGGSPVAQAGSAPGADGEVTDTAYPGAATDPDRPDPRRDPKLLRRRAWLYLVIGFILTALGLQRWLSGDTGILTWFVLGIGAFDLVGGWMMMNLSRRIAEVESQGGILPPQNPPAA